MKRINIISFILLFAVVFTGCKPFYRCGDPLPKKKMYLSKRTKSVLSERDQLCEKYAAEQSVSQQLREDSTLLSQKIDSLGLTIDSINTTKAGLEKDLSKLQQDYEEIVNTNLSQAEQFNRSLRSKSEELTKKEQLLAEREAAMTDLQRKIDQQDSITRRLNNVIRKALLGFKSDELSVEVKNGKVYVSMSDKLLFKSGSAAVETKGKDALTALADVLNKNMDIDILVEGHTDNVPFKSTVNYKDNWELSTERALSIVRILTEDNGVIQTRVTAAGRGEFMPKVSNDTPEGRATNRRTEIILSPKLDEIMNLIK